MTKSQRMRESAVMISSTMPSTKYSCSGSPLKRQYRDRRLVRERQHRLSRRCGVGGGVAHPVDPHWPCDVLDLLLAQILEDEGQPVADVVMHRIGDEHPAGIGERLDARGD